MREVGALSTILEESETMAGTTTTAASEGQEMEVEEDEEENKENNCNPAKDIINPEIIGQIIAQIQRCTARNRRVRMKLLIQIDKYFYNVSDTLEKDASAQHILMECIDQIQDLILESTKLCVSLSEPEAKIHEISDMIYEIGSYIETIICSVFTWCVNENKLFGPVVRNLLDSLVRITCANPEMWLYSVMISPCVMHILNGMDEDEDAESRTQWAQSATEQIKEVAKAIFKCGDFGCQYHLVTVFHRWAQWVHSGRAWPLINSMFSFVDPTARKELLMKQDSAKRVRNFLNSLNLSPKGPKCVIPIMCCYIFVGEYMLNLEEFWVDFSVGSGRLHAFYTVPENRLVSLSIRKDQIDSCCLNWVVNDGRSQAPDTPEYVGATQSSTSTFAKNEKVLFFHIVLNTEFENITQEHKNLDGEHRSIYFVFRNGQLVEKILQEMNYALHICGTKDCQRPRALRHMLANQNKLSYSQSWCPDSQVLGLDKSPLDRSVSHFDLTGQSDPDTTVSRIRQRLRSPHQSHRSVSPSTPFRLESLSSPSLDTQTQDEEEAGQSFSSARLASRISESETSTAFYPSVSGISDEDAVTEVCENETYNGTLLNTTGASTDTFYEDPLPRKIRKKFADQAPKHIPFIQLSTSPQQEAERGDSRPKQKVLLEPEDKENILGSSKIGNVKKRGKYPRNAVRNSSPKPSASQIRSPPTPPISEICSPPQSVFNATIPDFEENCSPEASREEFQNDETGLPPSPEEVTIWNEEEGENEEKSYVCESDQSDVEDQEENNSNIENRGSPSEAENDAENWRSAPNAIGEGKKSESGSQLENLRNNDAVLQKNRDTEPSVIPASPSQNPMEVDAFSSHAESFSLSPIIGFSKTLLPNSMAIVEKSPSPTQDPDAKVVVFKMAQSESTAPKKNPSPKFDVADETAKDSDWEKTIISESDSDEQYSPPRSKSSAQASTQQINGSSKSPPKTDLSKSICETPSRAESSSPSVYSPSPVFTPSPVKPTSPVPSACSSLSPIVGFSKVLMDRLQLSDKSSESSPESMRGSNRKRVPERVPVKKLRFEGGSKTVRKSPSRARTPPTSSAKVMQQSESNSPNSRQHPPPPTGKLPCYAYAFELRQRD